MTAPQSPSTAQGGGRPNKPASERPHVPLAYTWDGEAMRPLRRFARQADQQFCIGEVYTLEELQERSQASHRQFFAAVRECWASLPEDLGERFPTPEALCKYALIRTGYRDERSIVCASRAEAQRLAAFIRPMDDFAIVTVSEAVVTVYTAKSQSMRAMGRAEFQASKQGVLDVLADMLGVAPATLPQAEAA